MAAADPSLSSISNARDPDTGPDDDFTINNMSRVFDGARWVSVVEPATATTATKDGEGAETKKPLPPIIGKGNDKIFVSVTNFRDSKRCAKTLQSLFTNIMEPRKVVVGLVDQIFTAEKETSCLQEYCRLVTGKADSELEECAHTDQVRVIAQFSKGAAGPIAARALQRKNLANEEYCLQVDAQTEFTPNWDREVRQQWTMAGNEFAVISTLLPSMSERPLYENSGERAHQVPRMCTTSFTSINIPVFAKPKDGVAEKLEKPLLAHAWNAGFSFHKCHLEEAAPYDYFLPQIFDGEEFPRYARMWTRGYDVYTPTKNIVYHDYGPNPDGHDMKGWPRRDVLRNQSIQRMKTLLQMPAGEGIPTQANFGLFGLGKRRTLKQLQEFVGVDLTLHTVDAIECANKEWIPYDLSVSATENLYDHAQDLDPQPEYPKRKHMQQPDIAGIPKGAAAKLLEIIKQGSSAEEYLDTWTSNATGGTLAAPSAVNIIRLASAWVIILLAWCVLATFAQKRQSKTGQRAGLRTRSKVTSKQPRAGRSTNGSSYLAEEEQGDKSV